MSSEASVSGEAPRRRAYWLPLIVLVAGSIGAVAYMFRRDNEDPVAVPLTDVAEKDGLEPEAVWETELFADAASKQLNLLAEAIEEQAEIDRSALSTIVVPTISCERLRPESLQEAFADESITVLRGFENQPNTNSARGVEVLLESLKALKKPLAGASDIHVKFKITGVDVGESAVTTNVIYQASGRFVLHTVQQTGVWLCQWQRTHISKPPLLEQISVDKFEEVIGRGATGALFADCTEAVFRNEPTFAEQLLPGIDYWRGSIQAQYGVYPYGHHGIAVGDVNRDGLDDVYVCQPAGLPNRLYLQNLDGTVTDVAASAGVDWLDRCRGALLIDLDNDGDQDLIVSLNEMIIIMANDDEVFSEKTVFRPTGDPGSLAAADYDRDGDLDVFVVNYGQRFLSDGESSGPIPYHDANNGGPNMLLRNDGDWNFTDVTRQCGLDTNNRRWSFAASWEDYDADGDTDLYVANDFGRNNLYRNDGGTFVDVAAEAGVEDIASGMSASWADYNQDGRMDLYVGNMFSSAGLRISYQDRFQSQADGSVRAQFQRLARGNSLFLNAGDGTFDDASVEAGVTVGRWAWASKFVDINNDGLEDLVIANGFVTGTDTKDL